MARDPCRRYAASCATAQGARASFANHKRATEYIAVAAEILGAAMHDDIDAEVEWCLAYRCCEGVVTCDQCT